MATPTTSELAAPVVVPSPSAPIVPVLVLVKSPVTVPSTQKAEAPPLGSRAVMLPELVTLPDRFPAM